MHKALLFLLAVGQGGQGSALANSPSCDTLRVSASPVFRTSPAFASWNVDSSRQRSFFDINLADHRITSLASQIGGHRLRFGGTGNDFLFYSIADGMPPCPPTVPYVNECFNASLWRGLTTLAASSRSELIFGISMLPFNSTWHPSPYPEPDQNWQWNSTNAAALLRAAKAAGIPIWGLELGNEVDNEPPHGKGWSAQQQSSAAFKLHALLDEIYGTGPGRPVIVGPDAHGFHVPVPDPHSTAMIAYITDYVNRTQQILTAVTHHEYIEINETNVLDPAFLDNTKGIARNVMAAVRAINSSLEVWAGEIGPHNGGNFGPQGQSPNCEGNRVCGRFGSALWYADAMAAKAREGYSAFFRQVDDPSASFPICFTSLYFFGDCGLHVQVLSRTSLGQTMRC